MNETPRTDAAIAGWNKLPDTSVSEPIVRASFARTLERELIEAKRWPKDGDEPLPEDAEIESAHPCETDDHKTYKKALRLVGARRSKFGLVNLVNWLLTKSNTQN